MIESEKIKRYGIIYDFLQDLNEYAIAEIIEEKMKDKGYKVVVQRGKYRFKLN